MYPTKKLWEICKVIKWKNPELFLEVWEWKVPYLTAKFIRWFQFPNFALVSDKKSTLVNKQDIVIICDWSNSGETFIGLEWILSSTMWKLAFNQKIDTLFINHFLVLIIKELKTRRFWAAIPHLDIKGLLSYEIPLPPLQTQKLIVQKLDSSFENINKQIDLIKTNLSSLDELNKSVLEKVFSEWEIFTFDEICNKVTDWSHNPPKWVDNWIPMISSRNLDDNNNVTFDNIRYIDEENYIRENKRTNVEEWDILLSIVWTIWKVAIVKTEYWKFVMQRSLAVLKLKSNLVDSFYIYYFLKSNISQKILTDWANWAAQQWIYLNEIKKLTIPLPPLQKQKEIVTYLDQVFEKNKELKIKYEEQFKELEELKQSLLKDAFEGKLVRE